jgi:hypothetical protein
MAQQHPKFPDASPGTHVNNIFALVALECDAAQSRLLSLYKAEFKKNNFSSLTGKSRALWEGFTALRDKTRENFFKAQTYGQLPYAFHGTKAFMGAEVAA